jgi:hypothetical protein
MNLADEKVAAASGLVQSGPSLRALADLQEGGPMKRFLMFVGVSAVVGSLYVAAASGSQHTRVPTAKQFAALKKKVTGLQKEVGQISKAEKQVISFLTCYTSVGVLPVTERGDPKGAWGYQYNSSAGGVVKPQTALDVATTNPQALLQAVDPKCLVAATIIFANHRRPGTRGGGPLALLPEHMP